MWDEVENRLKGENVPVVVPWPPKWL
jgi:hypothetical protein